jgi:hypothetical protein
VASGHAAGGEPHEPQLPHADGPRRVWAAIGAGVRVGDAPRPQDDHTSVVADEPMVSGTVGQTTVHKSRKAGVSVDKYGGRCHQSHRLSPQTAVVIGLSLRCCGRAPFSSQSSLGVRCWTTCISAPACRPLKPRSDQYLNELSGLIGHHSRNDFEWHEWSARAILMSELTPIPSQNGVAVGRVMVSGRPANAHHDGR